MKTSARLEVLVSNYHVARMLGDWNRAWALLAQIKTYGECGYALPLCCR